MILAEAVDPEHGLGYIVELARTHQKASWSFAGLLVLGGIGLLMDFSSVIVPDGVQWR